MNRQTSHLVELIGEQAKRIPDDTFLVYQNECFTYADAEKKSNQVANLLAARGIRKGDHIALMLKNHPDYLWIWFGIAKLGAVMIPLNVHAKGESLCYTMNHSDAVMLIVDQEYSEEIVKIKTDLTQLQQILHRDELMRQAHKESGRHRPYTAIRKEDPLSIIYTSGTTGRPKGVVLSHYSYINTGLMFRDVMMRIRKDDILYTCLPLFHCNAQQLSVMSTLLSGAKLVLSERFSASRFWEEIRQSQATIFNYIGSMLTILMKQPPQLTDQDNTITRVFGGGAPKEIWREFEQRFGLTIVEGYGLTESATVCLCNSLEEIRVGSIGKPLPHISIRVVNEQDQETAPNEVGEIAIREDVPHTQFSGYYKMPDKTEEAIKDGWFHTGDRGYRDEDGYFYFKDRLKDCIRYRGENISSYEIEQVVNKYPSVRESAAIGVPSEVGEEDVKVVLTLQPNHSLDYQDFLSFCQERMAYYMVPRYVEVVEELPKTATQRIQKYALRQQGSGLAFDCAELKKALRGKS
ncbi:ATP-dependent acyl-CoA ligase [Brevibacillus humidisoli]|uniref:ATP-dependent acyl-CoA ligase n=1 Tax=Brevibacillus humidisoli TaxID=2895522 RepID=UPI001E5801AE|nr:ATP-dependent acyl-CoA ligase [Brevibacillus humidisoli]UFJ42622.1 ATP-dependent acyl-CoA ligase [Brevibacillus humidisoli]